MFVSLSLSCNELDFKEISYLVEHLSLIGGIIPTTTTTTPAPSIGGFGEAIGEAAFQFTNNIINPCRGGRFGPIQEAGQGFLAGFIGSGISNSIFGNPCG